MKKRYITTTIALMLLTAAVTYSATLYVTQQKYDQKFSMLNTRADEYARIAEVQGYIEDAFVNEYDKNKMIEGALTGMVAYLGDRWSHYLNAEDFKAYNDSMSSRMVGIGVNVVLDEATGGIRIIDVYASSPASEAGLHPNDVVVAVDGAKVSELGYESAVNKVRGEAGTTVRLQIYRAEGNKTLEATIKRAAFHIENVKAQLLADNVGYIKIRGFDLDVDKEFIQAASNLQKQGAKAFVFDVRNNPGGAMTVLVNCLDILLPEGTIITAKDKAGSVKEYKSDANELKLPMAVLTNQNSISAAEFFAASLQEYNKATVIGTATTGKGCAQTPIELKDGSGLIISTSKYYTKNGISLADTKGIKPNVEVKLTDEQMKRFYTLTPQQDPQLQAAIKNVKSKVK